MGVESFVSPIGSAHGCAGGTAPRDSVFHLCGPGWRDNCFGAFQLDEKLEEHCRLIPT